MQFMVRDQLVKSRIGLKSSKEIVALTWYLNAIEPNTRDSDG